MLAEYFGRQAHCLVGIQSTFCIYIQRQLVKVSDLTHTGILHCQVYTLNRRIDGVYRNHTDGHVFCLAFVRADIAASLCNRQLHIQLAVRSAVQCGNDLIRIHDLDILIYLDIGSSHNALTLEFNVSDFCLIGLAVVADCKALQIHDDLGNVFFHTGNRAEFMENSLDFHLADSRTRQRGEHDSSQGVAQSRSIASFQRFYNKSAVFFIIGNLCNLNFWFVEIKHTRPSFMGQFISADPSGAQNMPSVSATVSFPKENLTNTEGDISKRGPRPEHKPQLTFII